VEAGEPGERQREPHARDQLVRAQRGLAVAGEVVGQRYDPLPLGRHQDDGRVEREQRGREVADRRRGAEVAADGGAVADEPRRELREHRIQQRHRAVQPALDLGERQRGPDLDVLTGLGEDPQLGEVVDRDQETRPRATQVGLDPEVRGTGQGHGAVLRQRGQALGEGGRT
jgi:hypothetical protein